MHPHSLVQARLASILSEGEPERLRSIGAAIEPAIPRIVDTFYSQMKEIEEARGFLDHHIVDTRLRASMAGWLRALFVPRPADDIPALVAAQRRVGEVHARIRVPIHLVMHGIQILYRAISEERAAVCVDVAQTREDLLLVSDLLQYTAVVINESFVRSTMRGEREALSLRESLLSGDLAVECERARASLFDWARQVVDAKLRPAGRSRAAPSVRDSDWGRWLLYRGELLMGGDATLQQLKVAALELDARIAASLTLDEVDDCVDDIQRQVSSMSLLLSRLSERALARGGARDPLTRLLNRRFLDTVLQREVELALTMHVPFSVLVLDLDHFKRVNDAHGHGGGDEVLRQTAQLLLEGVRTSDFVFRYGGEEFVVVLGAVDADEGPRVAEALAARIREHEFVLSSGVPVGLTASIGVAVHDGHPDYRQLIERADAAVFRAKDAGRDRVIVG
jgi:diguanylate cyclase